MVLSRDLDTIQFDYILREPDRGTRSKNFKDFPQDLLGCKQ